VEDDPMKVIYISDNGDDKNDGLTRKAAVHSWKRATKLAGGNMEINLTDATRERINEEIKQAMKTARTKTKGSNLRQQYRRLCDVAGYAARPLFLL
jgi:hypothetical protein